MLFAARGPVARSLPPKLLCSARPLSVLPSWTPVALSSLCSRRSVSSTALSCAASSPPSNSDSGDKTDNDKQLENSSNASPKDIESQDPKVGDVSAVQPSSPHVEEGGRLFGPTKGNRPAPPRFVVVQDDMIEETEDTPDDLRLPTPGAPSRRTAAGLVDLTMACTLGGLVGTTTYWGIGVLEAAEAAGVVATTAAWIVRDCLFDDGNRSLGKKWFNLEIAYWDGTLAHRADCLKRNIHFAVVPFAYLHPLANQLAHVAIAFDVASVLVTTDTRKAGDYLAGTRVVNERPNRDQRLLDMWELEEIKMLDKRLRHLELEANQSTPFY